MEFKRLYREIKTLLTDVTDSPAYEARVLLELAAGGSFEDMMFGNGYVLSAEELQSLDKLVKKRLDGYPIQYLLGKWSFMGRDYLVGEGVLIPRDDTEVLVRTAISMAQQIDAINIFDLCSGSGIIAVTLAKEIKNSRVTAVELSESAFEYLKRNCAVNEAANVLPVMGDVFVCFENVPDRSVDMLVSNPPYIARSEADGLQRELLSEPDLALFGGEDGLDFYRGIIKNWILKVKHGGAVAFEIGDTQAGAVTDMMLENGLCRIKIVKDIQGYDRVVCGFVE